MKLPSILLGLVSYWQCAIGQGQLGINRGSPVVYKIWSDASQAGSPSAGAATEKNKRHYYIQQQNVIVCYPGSNEASCKNLLSTIPGFQTSGANLQQTEQHYPQSALGFAQKPNQSYRHPEQSLEAPSPAGVVPSTAEHVPAQLNKLSTPIVCIQGSNQPGCFSPPPPGPEVPFSYFNQAQKPGQATYSSGCLTQACNQQAAHHTTPNHGLNLPAPNPKLYNSNSSYLVPVEPAIQPGFSKPICYPGSRLPGCNLKTPFIQDESKQAQLPNQHLPAPSPSHHLGSQQNHPTVGKAGCGDSKPASNPAAPAKPQSPYSNSATNVPVVCTIGNPGCTSGHQQGAQFPAPCLPGTQGCGGGTHQTTTSNPAHGLAGYSGQNGQRTPIVCTAEVHPGCAANNPEKPKQDKPKYSYGSKQNGQGVPTVCTSNTPGCSGSNNLMSALQPNPSNGYGKQSYQTGSTGCTPGSPGCGGKYQDRNANKPGQSNSYLAQSSHATGTTTLKPTASYHNSGSTYQTPIVCTPGSQGCGSVLHQISFNQPAAHPAAITGICNPGTPGCKLDDPAFASALNPASNAQGASAWIPNGPPPCTTGDNQPGCQFPVPHPDAFLPVTDINVPVVCANGDGKGGCSNPLADTTLPPPVLCSGGSTTAGCAILPPDVTPLPLNPTTIPTVPYYHLIG